MKRQIIGALFGAFIFAVSAAANAATLRLEPSSVRLGIGSTLTLNLVVSGLANLNSPTLSVFDVDLSYDAALFDLDEVRFGQSLGDEARDEAGTVVDLTVPGLANFGEFSLLESDALEILQSDSFTLATLRFNTISAGMASFGLAVNSLGDGFGDPVDYELAPMPDVSIVPIPAAFSLFGSVIAVLGTFARLRPAA